MAEIAVRSAVDDRRSLVRLRVPMTETGRAAAALQLPSEPLRWSGTSPAALWVSPDQWLLVDEARSAQQLIGYCDAALGDTLHSATDSSDALTCITVGGAGARGLLAMLSGVDFDAGRFAAGQCVRTRMAKVAVLVRAMIDGQFELFVDRSVGPYLEQWLHRAAQDPNHLHLLGSS